MGNDRAEPVGAEDRSGKQPRRFSTFDGVLVVAAIAAVAGSAAYIYHYQKSQNPWAKFAQVHGADDAGAVGGAGRLPETARMMRPRRFIKQENGKRLLWANGGVGTMPAEWFDVTDATIPPERFEHGIGKDTIAAIDDPLFLGPDLAVLAKSGIRPDTVVIGYVHNGEAKAYPIQLLMRHELANDVVGGKPVTVGY